MKPRAISTSQQPHAPPLIPVDEALETILAHFAPLGSEVVALHEAHRRILADDLIAPHDLPPFRNSAMDGYALRAADIVGASTERPRWLPVAGLSAAGDPPPATLPVGAAMRIMTGAPLPRGADTVVRFEETSEGWEAVNRPADGVLILRSEREGANVRCAGEDVRAGERVLTAGSPLHPPQIALLAALGQAQVAVVRRPRVGILATGDELLPPDAPLAPGRIRNSNEAMLAAWVVQVGGEPWPLGIARDEATALRAKLAEALAVGCDLILTSAGVSVGDFDRVKEVLAAEGEMHFWQVAIKPGKPLAFGVVRHGERHVPLLGLPGNPVASAVAFHVFAQPAIRRMGQRWPLAPPRRTAQLAEPVHNSGRRHYLRAFAWRDEDGTLRVTTRGSGVQRQGSGILSVLAWANCFAIVPEDVYYLETNQPIAVEPIQWAEEEWN